MSHRTFACRGAVFTFFVAQSVIFSNLSVAEGPPIDRKSGEVTVPHIKLAVSNEQAEEMTVLGTLTLTAEQQKKLHQIFLAFPKRVPILSITYNDCSCGIGSHAVRIGEREVAFRLPYDDQQKLTASQEINSQLLQKHMHSENNGEPIARLWVEVRINSRGEIFIEGVRGRPHELVQFFRKPELDVKRKAEKIISISSVPSQFHADANDKLIYSKGAITSAAAIEKIGTANGWTVHNTVK